jgi:uncharacterized protein (DUF2384 family)
MQALAAATGFAPGGAIGHDERRTALEVFARLADTWGLTSDQQIALLGHPARSTFFKWKKDGGSLPADTHERLSHIFSIFKALEILLPDAREADAWMRRPNRVFSGESPLDHAIAGGLAGLYEVRRYLDAQRGG